MKEFLVLLVTNILCWIIFVGFPPSKAISQLPTKPKDLTLNNLKVTQTIRMKSGSGDQDLLIEAKKNSVALHLNNAKGTLTMYADDSSVPYFEIKEKETNNSVAIFMSKDNKPYLEIVGPNRSGLFPLEQLIEWLED